MISEDTVYDDRSTTLESRVGQLDESVERLTTEVSSLKLEVATLTSALRELRAAQSGRRVAEVETPVPIAPPVRPTLVPAAVVVLVATSLLSWQLIMTPSPDRMTAPPISAVAARWLPSILPDQPSMWPPAELPSTPFVRPTIYKGTLSVNADRPGATVFVNRQNVGQAPVRIRNLRAGAHLVWIEHDGYRRWTRVITVPAERVTRVSADLEPVGPQ